MSSLRALVLEDHPFQRSVAVQMLRQLGYVEVLESASGGEALSLLQSTGRVDLLICDLCMDGVDGIELLRAVSLSELVGQVIICSSLSADLRRAAAQIGSLLGIDIVGVLPKPLHLDKLQLLIDGGGRQGKTTALPTPSVVHMPSEADVRRGLFHKEFEAHYQPKLNVIGGGVTGFEVLARWRHPRQGLLSPAAFMTVIEHCGLLDELFFQMLEQGLRFRRTCLSRGMPISLSFNLDVNQLTSTRLVPRIKMHLQGHRTSGHGLTFEITEGGVFKAPVVSLENLLRLRMLGCGLSIDDFGAGFSSLQRLCQLPFNEIKLDGAFVRNLESQPRCKAAIKSIAVLADSLGMNLVVEGIETIKQHHLVAALGGSGVQGQGYFYGRPMPSEEVGQWLGRAQATMQ